MNATEFLSSIHQKPDKYTNISILQHWVEITTQDDIDKRVKRKDAEWLKANMLGDITEAKRKDKCFQFDELIEYAKGFDQVNIYDAYFSINGYRIKHRTEANTWRYNCFALDYDYYKIAKYKDLTAEEMYDLHIRPTLAFEPTHVIDSGRGLYVLYVFESCPKTVNRLYKAIYKALIKQQQSYRAGIDPKASLTTQVIRIPGSYNSKSNSRVSIIESNETKYKLADFACLLPYTRKETQRHLEKIKQKNRDIEATNKKDKSNEPPGKNKYAIRDFKNLYEDFKRLVKMWNDTKSSEGYRELLLYITQYQAMHAGIDETVAYNYAFKLNGMFHTPVDPTELNEYSKPKHKYANRYSINKILELLDEPLRELEQEQFSTLKYLVSKDTKYEHSKRKKHLKSLTLMNRTPKEVELYIRRGQVAMLLRAGVRQIDIAWELNLSKQTVSTDVKYIKEHAYEFLLSLEEVLHQLQAYIEESSFIRRLTQSTYKWLQKWLKTADGST